MKNTFGKLGKTKALKQVMIKAWELFRNNFISFSEALKRAWEWIRTEIHRVSAKPISINEIKAMLHKGIVEFGYYKKCGEYRVFKATLQFNLIPNTNHPTQYNRGTNLRFFDYNANGWRSVATHTKTLYIVD